jgi:hypothetical protein
MSLGITASSCATTTIASGNVLLLLRGGGLVDESSYNTPLTVTEFYRDTSLDYDGYGGGCIVAGLGWRYGGIIEANITTSNTYTVEFAIKYSNPNSAVMFSYKDISMLILGNFYINGKLTNIPPETNVWQFYRIAVNNASVKVYLNGVLAHTTTITPTNNTYLAIYGSKYSAYDVWYDSFRITNLVALEAGMPAFPLTTTP